MPVQVETQSDDAVVAVPPRPRRPRPGARRPGPWRAGLRWALSLTALIAVGVLAALVAWRELAPAAQASQSRLCVARAVEDASAFAAVLGDPRPVDREDLEPSCRGRR